MRAIIFGGTGLLGDSIYRNLTLKKYDCLKTSKKKKSNLKTNLLSKNVILRFLKKNKPQLIVNCAGETNVDLCNRNFNIAYNSNVLTVRNIVDALNQLKFDSLFIHISTDQVYNSNKIKKTNHENEINISNVYAGTKFLSEIEALKYHKSLILRTNFYGKSLSKNRKSFSDFILSQLYQKKKIKMPSNIFFNPIHIDILNAIILKLIKKKATGIFNIGSKDCISRYNFAIKIAKKFNLNNKNIIKYKSIYKNDQRPLCTYMATKKLKKKIKIKVPLIKDGIKLI